MLPIRKQIHDFARSCEHLISESAIKNAVPFTPEEIDWIAYYAKEMTSLVDRLTPDPKPQSRHKRPSMHEYANASESMLQLDHLSEAERDKIRRSVADVTREILDEGHVSD
jgi:hypothetical protein